MTNNWCIRRKGRYFEQTSREKKHHSTSFIVFFEWNEWQVVWPEDPKAARHWHRQWPVQQARSANQ